MGETIRVEHSKDYTIIANSAIRDSRLSLKSRGLHHLLLSYPNGWEINIDHLSGQSEKDGKDAIASALKELEQIGYLTRTQIREKGKIVGYQSVIRELPIDNPPQPKGRRSKKKKQDEPQLENPDTAKPQLENPDTAKPDRDKPQLDNPQPENPSHIKYVLDQLSNQEISIPPNPQGDKREGFNSGNSNTEDPSPESIAPLSTKPESSDKQTNSLEGNFSAAARALNRNKADDYFNSPREFNSVKGTYKSASVDPWMASAHNPDKGFSEWLFSKRYKDKSSGTLADAKQEIRNNWERASDLWEEYQSELLKKEQRIEVNATIPIEPFKPQQNPGHRMTEEARNAFRQKLASK